MFAPIFWDRGDGITPTLSLYLPEINPHNNPIVGAANMQEMPRFSKAPRPPDGFIKGAYWPGACLLPIAYCPPWRRNVGHISKFPGAGKINQAGPRNVQIWRKIGDISKYPTRGNINQAALRNAEKCWQTSDQLSTISSTPTFLSCRKRYFAHNVDNAERGDVDPESFM